MSDTPDSGAPRYPVAIEDEMRDSYLSYAMSVIIGRALPDVRDGLKPVHRRILFAMRELKNTHTASYKKSARIVGDVIGKYHPHGDQAVYDALVRLAQDFSMRYLLVDGQGNFGSVDGDSPAAMRYTEARMQRLASELMADLDKETVDFVPNYDESLSEPAVLPSRVPNLLINGSAGIAVGMATNIPPHNLSEVVNATIQLIDHPDTTTEQLMQLVTGPDFPTGGTIQGRGGIYQAYTTGRGVIRVRGVTEIELVGKGDRERIVVREIPYQVNKAKLIEKIADLVRDKRLEGISDLRDESDREGMRIVIELKRDAIAQIVLNNLFSMTPLQSSFGITLLAIVGGQPKVLTLKEMLEHFIHHRKDVVTRRSLYDLRKAREREHILEGFKKALDHLDEIIALIRSSATGQEAKERLIARFEFSEIQAQEILNMRLQRLTGMERQKILDELAEIRKQIEYLEEILRDEIKLMGVIKDELAVIDDQYGDERRTSIVEDEGDIDIEDLIADEEVVVTVSHAGYVKRSALTLYRSQHRGGRGKTGATTKEEDFVQDAFIANTHDDLLIFTDKGRVYQIKVYQVPQAGRTSRGKPIVNLIPIEVDESIRAIRKVTDFSEGRSLIMATRKGLFKKTDLMAYSKIRSSGIYAIRLDDDDDLIAADIIDPGQHVLLASKNGLAIRFEGDAVRSIGRHTRGVIGMRLDDDDVVVGMAVLSEDASLLTVTENGFGKRTVIDEYRIQGRGGRGIITIKCSERNGSVVGTKLVTPDDDVLLITNGGKIIRMSAGEISEYGRNTQGVTLINLEEGEKVVGVENIIATEDV